MLRSEIHVIKPSHKLYKYCDDMCFKSKNLYNYATYIRRQNFIEEGKLISAFDLNKELKHHEAFKALPSKTAQKVIINSTYNWKSYFRSIKKWAKCKNGYDGKPNLPKYKPKNGRNVICFDYQQGSWKGDKYYFPCQNELYVKSFINSEHFRLCQIIPYGNCYKISMIYEKMTANKININENYLAIDTGVNNFATLTNNIGLRPIVINGRIIKSVNNYYNKLRGNPYFIEYNET
jgi:putative transposase